MIQPYNIPHFSNYYMKNLLSFLKTISVLFFASLIATVLHFTNLPLISPVTIQIKYLEIVNVRSKTIAMLLPNGMFVIATHRHLYWVGKKTK